MRLSILCKRFPQQRDLLARPYGRFHHLPEALARQGHDVQVTLVGHRGLPEVDSRTGGVQRTCLDIRSLGPRALYSRILHEAAEFRPDWVIGFSDATFGWLAGKLARKLDTPLALDAYDDYEAYMPWNLPLHLAWRSAIGRAGLVTAAGPQLAEKLQRHRLPQSRPTQILTMTADPGFVPIPKPFARAELGLPADRPLLGYSGSWGKDRGMGALIPAFREVRRRRPEAMLVLTGSPPRQVLDEPGVLGIGYLTDERMPLLVNAIDVACVIATTSRFGRYSYPSKLCEAIACATPVVASATAPIRWMLGGDSRWLVPPDDEAALAARLLANLDCGKVTDYPAQQDWNDIGARYAALLSGH